MENNVIKRDNPPFDKVMYEPKKTNRFIIECRNIEIPNYCFNKYIIYNISDTIYFETEFWEVVHFSVNPVDLFKITEMTLSHVDPTGTIISSYIFNVKNVSFEQSGDYKEDTILKYRLKFETFNWTKIIDINSNTNNKK